MKLSQRLRPLTLRLLFLLSMVGPGLITASADNDAPGIATYSVAGSTYGYGFLWIVLWVTLGEIVVQEMAARMGASTAKGLTDLIRERFGVRTALTIILGLGISNLGTTVAQFAGIAASGELLGVNRYLIVPIAALVVWFLVLRGSYYQVEKTMLLLSLYALAYVASALLARPSWAQVLQAAAIPTLRLERHFLLTALATVGTTITPWGCAYLQASVADKKVSMTEYGYTRLDVVIGAALGNVVSAFIIIATAATLFVNGIQVDTAQEAALALEPLAGPLAKHLFALGMLGASLLASAVLPLATTYSVCEAFGWERGIDHGVADATAFYGLYTALIVVSAVVVLIPGIPLFPLMWLSQVLNAILLPVVLLLMLRLANDARIMRKWRNSTLTNVLATLLAVTITLATLALLADAFS